MPRLGKVLDHFSAMFVSFDDYDLISFYIYVELMIELLSNLEESMLISTSLSAITRKI